ncbi:hypothetical protein [Dyella sp.]|jgi:hypothetical protein|uniref:hypothetical protein n=1 Tax=Dyella sp. TaxID=1869338 RepID=UPI002D78AD35|nr:hypothetical protein [Dyella sp.]HET6433550.1 hypothetical protein [Dyella sp.]
MARRIVLPDQRIREIASCKHSALSASTYSDRAPLTADAAGDDNGWHEVAPQAIYPQHLPAK